MRSADRPLTTDSWAFHPSVEPAVAKLRCLGIPLLACGQTVFWDEPVKVVLREMLDALAPELPMFLGVHDTDYFSRGGPSLPDEKGCVALPHNDFSTRGLWAAAGEISVLFGGEVVPSQQDFAQAGVSLEKAARAAEEGKVDFLNAITGAWGWKGLACLGKEHPVAGQMPLPELLQPLLALLRWGFDTSAGFLASDDAKGKARQLGELVIGWVTNSLQSGASNEAGAQISSSQPSTLADLYRRLLPRLCSLLLGREARNLHFFSSSEFFRLNSATAAKPRFALLSLFLDPDSAGKARDAYNGAVRASGIYELERFGEDALPFEVVVPGRGRGTLSVDPSSVRVGFESGEVRIPVERPLRGAEHLARALETALGESICLVGKAIVLPLMLAAEFVMVLHEGASVYIPLTKKMHLLLRQQGLDLRAHPLLRLRYDTWNSLSNTPVRFQLPSHLALAFGMERISAGEFAATWEGVVAHQAAVLEHPAQLKTPEELLAYLTTRDASWKPISEEWSAAHRTLHETGEWVKCYRMEADCLTASISALGAEAAELERQKGRLRRGELAVSESQGHQADRQELTLEIRVRHAAIRQKKAALNRVLCALRSVENGEPAIAARRQMTRIEASAELAKARQARNALLTQGLMRANYRPTAWWFPLVDPEGHWFRQVVQTTELFFEELDGN